MLAVGDMNEIRHEPGIDCTRPFVNAPATAVELDNESLTSFAANYTGMGLLHNTERRRFGLTLRPFALAYRTLQQTATPIRQRSASASVVTLVARAC